MTSLEFVEKYFFDVIDVKALTVFQRSWFAQQQQTPLTHQILRSRAFKRQYFRGKLSRQMKKRVKRETGLDVRSPQPHIGGEFAYRLGYIGLLSAVDGRQFAENLAEMLNCRRPRLNQNGQMPNVHNIGDELSLM